MDASLQGMLQRAAIRLSEVIVTVHYNLVPALLTAMEPANQTGTVFEPPLSVECRYDENTETPDSHGLAESNLFGSCVQCSLVNVVDTDDNLLHPATKTDSYRSNVEAKVS